MEIQVRQVKRPHHVDLVHGAWYINRHGGLRLLTMTNKEQKMWSIQDTDGHWLQCIQTQQIVMDYMIEHEYKIVSYPPTYHPTEHYTTTEKVMIKVGDVITNGTQHYLIVEHTPSKFLCLVDITTGNRLIERQSETFVWIEDDITRYMREFGFSLVKRASLTLDVEED